MDKTDARKFSQEMQCEIRKYVIRLRKKGLPNKLVAEVVGVSISHASNIWQAYLREGDNIIGRGKRGRRNGANRRLDPLQEQEVQTFIIANNPTKLKMATALWTREAVASLIEFKYGYRLPLSTVGDYLRRWEFTAVKPIKYARRPNSPQLKQWLKGNYSAIVMQAKKVKAEIYWSDVTVVDSAEGTVTMLLAVNNKGKTYFMLQKGAMTDLMVIKFMRRLTKSAGRKVFLLVDDRVPGHELTELWLSSQRSLISVFTMPADFWEADLSQTTVRR